MWLVAAGLAASSCAGLHYTQADAGRMVLAAVRLTPSAARRGVVPRVELIRTSPRGWALRVYAMPPCDPGIDVCSNLLGHYSVSRRELRLVNEDAGFDGVRIDTPATRRAREAIIRAHCRALSNRPS